jgi:hypothetical protein
MIVVEFLLETDYIFVNHLNFFFVDLMMNVKTNLMMLLTMMVKMMTMMIDDVLQLLVVLMMMMMNLF